MAASLAISLGHVLAAFADFDPTDHEPLLTSIEIDSREVKPGSMFVAFVGENLDGHTFVPQAFEKGARVALVEKEIEGYPHIRSGEPLSKAPEPPFCILVPDTEAGLQGLGRYWREQFVGLNVIGITGSVGKTSTKELAHAVLSNKYSTLKTPKNYNNEIGLPLTLLLLEPHQTHAVLEMGMYAKGEIDLLCQIAKPKIGVVTNIGPVHLSRLGTIEAIVQAKRELVESLPSHGVAILNRDDAHVMSMAAHTKANIFTYGLTPAADLWADDIRSYGLQGISFTLYYEGRGWRIQVPLIGRHSVHTALRATAIGLACGMDMEEIIRGLHQQQNQVRLFTVRGPRESLILDDSYNASPDSVLAALNLLDDLDGRKIAVLGDMLELGSAEEAGHRRVGRRALEVADKLVTVGERGMIIAEEALLAGMSSRSVFAATSVEDAIDYLQKEIQKDDIVLVKGSWGARLDRIVAALSRTKDQIDMD